MVHHHVLLSIVARNGQLMVSASTSSASVSTQPQSLDSEDAQGIDTPSRSHDLLYFPRGGARVSVDVVFLPPVTHHLVFLTPWYSLFQEWTLSRCKREHDDVWKKKVPVFGRWWWGQKVEVGWELVKEAKWGHADAELGGGEDGETSDFYILLKIGS
jgi:hypothetical protein